MASGKNAMDIANVPGYEVSARFKVVLKTILYLFKSG